MTPVIEIDGLTVDLGGRRILDNLKCSLSARTIGLLGPNGAGKSTLINTLLGFHKPAQGTARIFGHDIRTRIRSIRNLTGYMPENDAFIASMSAVSYVHLMAELSGLPPDAALERAHEALFYVGLGEARYRKLGTYSLGIRAAGYQLSAPATATVLPCIRMVAPPPAKTFLTQLVSGP